LFVHVLILQSYTSDLLCRTPYVLGLNIADSVGAYTHSARTHARTHAHMHGCSAHLHFFSCQ